jgi:hypothetical protein
MRFRRNVQGFVSPDAEEGQSISLFLSGRESIGADAA